MASVALAPAEAAGPDQRRAERFGADMPIEVGNDGSRDLGWVRDISATGVYFHTDTQQKPGSQIYITLEVTVRGEKLRLRCEGEVVRIDASEGRQGVAARLKHSFFSEQTEEADASALVSPEPPADI